MADLEVENTLREIRERVLAEAPRLAPEADAAADPARAAAAGAGSAGAGLHTTHSGHADEALARMDANLATTARAWSRLPPVLSYRRGAAARLELWLKRAVKRAAHWFTWEQVNFNSAVHHALGDARATLSAHGQALAAHEQALSTHEQALARLQSEILAALRAEAEADRARVSELQSRAAELQSRLTQAETRFETGGAQLRHAFAAGLERLAEAQQASAELREEMREEMREVQLSEIRTRAAEMHAEMRERLDGLLEEQRVCFKQLSLEAGEAAVTHDRARRQLEARLEVLENSRQ
jgi:hypothetical protein